MKKTFFLLLTSALVFNGCLALENSDSVAGNTDSGKLYEVYDIFKARYDAQKQYVAQNSFDTVGKSDLQETEKNLNFLTQLLNEGVACAKADYQYDPLGFYYNWYKSMKPLDRQGNVAVDGGKLQEFCYSNLSGAAIYSFAKQAADSTNYAVYGYWPGVGSKYYLESVYPSAADCALGEWTDASLKWSCKYEDKDKVKKEDQYSYDFELQQGALVATCSGEGDNRTCKNI